MSCSREETVTSLLPCMIMTQGLQTHTLPKKYMNCNFLFVYILDIDGGYTEWTEWTECTATCGGGTKRRSRNCTNPSPKNKGKTCIEQEQLGLPEESKECNTHECRKGRTIFSFVKFYERMTQFLPFPQSRFQSLRYPCPAERENESSGSNHF